MTPRYDIAILGSGPVATALALLLAHRSHAPARIALFGHAPQRSGALDDPRTLALNEGSRVSLAALHAWPAHTATIRNIHVSQQGRLGRTHIRHTDFDVPALGYVAAYPALLDALEARRQAAGIVRHDALDFSSITQDANGVFSSQDTGGGLAPGQPLSQVAVLADGAGASDITREYDQSAVLATVRATRPRPDWAYERFRNEGPLAVLPHPGGQDLYAIVWCCRPFTAKTLHGMDAGTFSRALTRAFGDRLGSFSLVGDRHIFPLSLKARRELVAGRIVAIGNAAQALHPVAGQGFNLGLRDAVQLAQSLGPWLANPDTSASAQLAQYARQRRVDRLVTGGLTDILPRVFATGLAPVEHACGAALLTMDIMPTLRAPLARQLLYGTRA